MRAIVPQTVKEFLSALSSIKNDAREAYDAVERRAASASISCVSEAEKGKQSSRIEFASIDDRDAAREVLGRRASASARASGRAVPHHGNIEA